MRPRSKTLPGNQPLWTRILLLFILGYEALGGLAGGPCLVARPDGALMALPVELMHGTFRDYLVPGLILTALGILGLVAFRKVLRRHPDDWLWASVSLMGWYIWFIVEILVLQELHWLHLMWGVPVLLGIIVVIPLIGTRMDSPLWTRGLLFCGFLSSLWYTFMNLVVPFQDAGYSSMTQTVSELSAIGAPTRILWVLLGTAYPLLYAAFGWGVLRVSGNHWTLKVLGALILGYSILNLYWPPMHTREAIAAGEKSLSDHLHIAWTLATVTLFILTMSFGAAALGRTFRIYTLLSAVVLMTFGMMTSMDVPNLEANLPTPLMGFRERVNQYVYFIWVIVLSWQLMRSDDT